MENATKALLIAGGVLIAIILISVLVHTYGNIRIFQKQNLTEEEIARIEEDNKAYTKYLGQYIYGTEVISIVNKALDSKYDVAVKIKFINDYTYDRIAYINGKKTTKKITVKAGQSITLDDDVELTQFIDHYSDSGKELYGTMTESNDGTTATATGLKNKVFHCDEIRYDNATGRVNCIYFTEKEIT